MDWSNTQYVRVYVGDSRDWIAFGWKGRALFVELLRATDRAGVMDYEGDDDIGILADQVRMPVEVVEEALPRLVKRGSVVLRGGKLVIPNKLVAQESTMSPAQRTREHRARVREKRRAVALFGNESLHDAVTIRDVNVTPGNAVKRDATPCNPEQSRAEQSRAGTPTGGVSDLQPDGVDLLGQSVKSKRSEDARPAQIARVVCGWIVAVQGRRPKPTSTSAVKVGAALAKLRATDDEIIAALELKAAEWEATGNAAYWGKPATWARKLPEAVESVRSGAKSGDFKRQPVRVVPIGGSTRADHERELAEARRQREAAGGDPWTR